MCDLHTIRARYGPIFVSILLLLMVFPRMLAAMDMRAGRRVTIHPGEVVPSNLYVAGRQISVSGRIDGDLTAAGGKISLDGTVVDDVTVGGGQIRVAGQVGGDLRAAGGKLELSGRINGDLVVAGGVVRVLPGTIIGGDVVLAGGDVVLEGTMARSVKTVAGQLLLNGAISGPVGIRAESLVIGEHARLENELTYFSPKEASIHSSAQVGGPVTFHLISGMDQNWLRFLMGRLGVAFFILRFAMTLGAGLLGYWLLRKPTQELVEYSLKNFGGEFLRGFVLFFVIPPAIFLLAITIVGAPVAFLGGLLHLSVGMVAIIYSGIALGTLTLKWLRRKPEFDVSWQAVLLGIPIAFLVRLVPYVGFLLNATFFLVIFGALYQHFWLIVRPPKV